MARVASGLGLAEPALPWHTSRGRVATLGSALATLSGALGKIALDVVLMAQTEVGEVSEPAAEGRGGSSTMPHKQNPVGSILTPACARRAQASAGLLTAGMLQEHERAASMAEVLGGLRGASRANGRQPGRDARADPVRADRLRPGRADCSARRARARQRSGDARGTTLRDELAAPADMPLSAGELDAAFAPETYVGAADAFIDRALDLYRSG